MNRNIHESSWFVYRSLPIFNFSKFNLSKFELTYKNRLWSLSDWLKYCMCLRYPTIPISCLNVRCYLFRFYETNFFISRLCVQKICLYLLWDISLQISGKIFMALRLSLWLSTPFRNRMSICYFVFLDSMTLFIMVLNEVITFLFMLSCFKVLPSIY